MTENPRSNITITLNSIFVVAFALLAILSGLRSLISSSDNALYFIESHSILRNELLYLSSFFINSLIGAILISSCVILFISIYRRIGIDLMDVLKPKAYSVAVSLFLISLSLWVLSKREYTSKITWIDQRGAPFGYLIVSDGLFACNPDAVFCFRKSIEAINLVPLIGNVFLCYYAVSMIYSFLRRHSAV